MSNGIGDRDPRVMKKLVDRAMTALLDHYKDPDLDSEENREALEHALRYRHDGYDICKSLDDGGWQGVDAELVAVMDDASWWRIEALKEVEQEEAGNVSST